MIFWVFLTSLSLLILGYPGYLTLLLLGSDKLKTSNIQSSELPLISMLIPAYNEEERIPNKIENTLNIEYPTNRLEIIIINDCSSDNTKEVVTKYATKYNRLKLMNQKERKGKPAALNLALTKAKGDIIVVSDADCLLQSDCIMQLIKRLQVPQVGLVGAFTRAKGVGAVYNMEQQYLEISNIIRLMEAKVDSPASVIASCYAFKKTLIPRFEENVLADDMWSCIKIREQGFRASYLLEAQVWELGTPDTLKKDFLHKTRKGIACLQVFSYFRHMLFNTKYGIFGTIILPSHVYRYMVCPYAFFILIASGVLLILSPYLIYGVISICFTILWGILILKKIRLKREDSSPHSIKGTLTSVFILMLLQAALILAQFSWITRTQDVRWSRRRGI
jgi:cellulose synthase/poly-beta-1,6-N-acetylglucosamine synthase-like glycosyltransferase